MYVIVQKLLITVCHHSEMHQIFCNSTVNTLIVSYSKMSFTLRIYMYMCMYNIGIHIKNNAVHINLKRHSVIQVEQYIMSKKWNVIPIQF